MNRRESQSRPRWTLTILLILAGACQAAEEAGGPRPHHSEAMETRIAELEGRIAQLETNWEENTSGILELIDGYHADDVEPRTRLDCSSPSYAWLRYKTFLFPVICESAQPYLDGFRLQLRIGNPYSADFGDLRLEVAWGEGGWIHRLFKGDEAPELKLRTKTVSYAESLEAGAWTRIALVLSPATSEEASRVSISLSSDAVALASP